MTAKTLLPPINITLIKYLPSTNGSISKVGSLCVPFKTIVILAVNGAEAEPAKRLPALTQI